MLCIAKCARIECINNLISRQTLKLSVIYSKWQAKGETRFHKDYHALKIAYGRCPLAVDPSNLVAAVKMSPSFHSLQ